MGADIHMYVEYISKESKKSSLSRGETPFWYSFGGPFGSRNYVMFGHLADVRHETPKAFRPKGLPDDLGWFANHDAKLFISDDGKGEHETTLTQAMNWSERLGCKIYDNHEGEPTWVDHPDWHSKSWLTTQEFATALRNYSKDPSGGGDAVEYKAILAAMRALEKSGNNETRIVFWFDN